MLWRRKASQTKAWDRSALTPAIRCSICTGEQVAGFIRRSDGSFISVCLLKTPADLETFRAEYGLGNEPLRQVY